MTFKLDFSASGPTHMMVNSGPVSSPKKVIELDWGNEDHRRCITACLVKGAYVMESDRSNGTELAPAWWESFHFRRLDEVKCACECVFCRMSGLDASFIDGAVFKYEPPAGARRHPLAPHYIVAFRGTMLRNPTFLRDVCHNLGILLNQQTKCNRFSGAHELVGRLVNSTAGDGSAVWLAGHSLGAAIALDLGRYMMNQRGFSLPTFLFNPPHVSLGPVADLMGVSEKSKRLVHHGSSVAKYVMGKTILRPQKKRMEAVFEKLSLWVPELYVHERDIICSGYIHHFELREQAQERFPRIAKSAATLAHRDLLHPCPVSGLGDKVGRQHLLPSARMWKNSSPDVIVNAHGLRQWWQKDLSLTCKRYSWP